MKILAQKELNGKLETLMMKFDRFLALVLFITLIFPTVLRAQSFSDRFAKGETSFGGQLGLGYTFNLPAVKDRTDLSFAFIFPNWQENVTGLIAPDSILQGAAFWQVEGGVALLTHRGHEYLVGFSPLMLEYKFLDAKRDWAPTRLTGAGFSMTNWKDQADYELGSEFQFLLHIGAGVEMFRKFGSYSFNYRLFHVSNAGIQRPNIGLNAHVFSLGLNF